MSILKTLALALALADLGGCAILSPTPLFELAKAGAGAAASAISTGPSKASNTVYHEHPTVQSVCVEYNPATPDPDIPPALQAELRTHGIDSRIYEAGGLPSTCSYRLSYTAQIDWDVPPLGDDYAAFLQKATLTLHDAEGRVVSSSSYALDRTFQMGKWSPVRSKLAPVVTALVTGFEG